MNFAPIETIARAGVGAVLVGVLESAVLAGLVYVAIRCGRPSATTRHALWWIVVWAAAALPLVSFGSSLRRIEHRHVYVAAPPAPGQRMTIHVTFSPQRERDSGQKAPVRNAVAAMQDATSALAAAPYATTLLATWLAASAVSLCALG
ncbi:MAG: hypothetical protein IAI50_18245, partial [Candidatus Eremiobacteraeota bacterium]|nr:hypothetical protein [Candidatus Eremiobacteraeota bacterium]